MARAKKVTTYFFIGFPLIGLLIVAFISGHEELHIKDDPLLEKKVRFNAPMVYLVGLKDNENLMTGKVPLTLLPLNETYIPQAPTFIDGMKKVLCAGSPEFTIKNSFELRPKGIFRSFSKMYRVLHLVDDQGNHSLAIRNLIENMEVVSSPADVESIYKEALNIEGPIRVEIDFDLESFDHIQKAMQAIFNQLKNYEFQEISTNLRERKMILDVSRHTLCFLLVSKNEFLIKKLFIPPVDQDMESIETSIDDTQNVL